jgi:hypothetical protein
MIEGEKVDYADARLNFAPKLALKRRQKVLA